jgi:hypothetical protein
MPLPEDIIIKVRQDFSEDDSLQVLQRLSELEQEDPDLFNDRILRCLVIYAYAKAEKLAEAVQVARNDWRDLISSAEYYWGDRIRLLELPFGIHPEAEVFRQWLTGRQIMIPWGMGDDKIWTIKYPEIRELSLKQVHQQKEVSDKILDANRYYAQLNLLCIRGPGAISESKAIEARVFVFYRRQPETGGFTFERFLHRPQDLAKRGNW